MKVQGYGICGPGEAKRYMRRTLEEFKRLCDHAVILVNEREPGSCAEEIALIKEFGFHYYIDTREWGKNQWKMKQDFVRHKLSGYVNERDMLVALDMDEVFCKHLTKEWLLAAPLDAYYVYFAELWNDEQHHKARLSFWNVRIWRWNGNTDWKQKPLHCGLAPEWCYKYHRFAPFTVLHYGTMLKEDREKKIRRYEQYDPNAVYLERDAYYTILKDDRAELLDWPELCRKVEHEVATYQQTKPRMSTAKKKTKFAYVKNPAGNVIDIPEKDLEETLKRKGFEMIGWAEDNEEELDELFGGEDVSENTETKPEEPQRRAGSYAPPADRPAPTNDFNPDTQDEESIDTIADNADQTNADLPDDELDEAMNDEATDEPAIPSPTEQNTSDKPAKPKKATPKKGKGTGKAKKAK